MSRKNGNLNPEYKELLIGCGNRRVKEMGPRDRMQWSNLVTLDYDKDCKPDVFWDLENFPYPFNDNEFNEIHAYDVLEHTGQQGDFGFFFDQFSEFWRILKPNGLMLITTPHWGSMWTWGDPGHKRVLAPGCFYYLSQKEYESQVGITKMTDYRYLYDGNFEVIKQEEMGEQLNVYLKAIKEKA